RRRGAGACPHLRSGLSCPHRRARRSRRPGQGGGMVCEIRRVARPEPGRFALTLARRILYRFCVHTTLGCFLQMSYCCYRRLLSTVRSLARSTPRDGILVVDDHEGTRDVFCAILRKAGFVVQGAASGAEGLLRIAEDRSIGLLITDIFMPGRLDGWRLAESGRAL